MGGSEEKSTPLVLPRLSNSLDSGNPTAKGTRPLVLLRLSKGQDSGNPTPKRVSTHLQNERMSHVGVHVICVHVVLSLLDSCSNLLFS